MKRSEQGFTLVELVVVIVILGILAATALPRFINVTNQARTAAVNGLAGGLRSAVTVAQAAWQAQGATGATANMTGTIVTVGANGVPVNTAAGIVAAMGCAGTPCQGNTIAGLGGATSTWSPPGALIVNCNVVYDPAGPTVTPTTTGC